MWSVVIRLSSSSSWSSHKDWVPLLQPTTCFFILDHWSHLCVLKQALIWDLFNVSAASLSALWVDWRLSPPISLFIRHWCTHSYTTSPLYSIMSWGKAPFLFSHLFMMWYVPKQITSATVMVSLMRCDSRITGGATGKHITDVHPCYMPHYSGSVGTALGYLAPSLTWHRLLRFMHWSICMSLPPPLNTVQELPLIRIWKQKPSLGWK